MGLRARVNGEVLDRAEVIRLTGITSWAQAADLHDPPEARWRRDPVAWARERAHAELWSRQVTILESVRDHRNTAVRSCHSASKTWTAGLVACWWLDVHPAGEARVVSTAPTSTQVDAALWYEINRFHSALGLRGTCHLREWKIGNQIIGIGRKPPDHAEAAFQGMHARHLLVIYDEAYGIPRSLWTEGSSLASNEYGRQLAIGNPDGPGEFEENCRPGSEWNVIHISYRDTPNFTGEPVSRGLRELLVSEAWVAERRAKWGEDSPLFQSKCEGNFPSAGDPAATVPYDWAARCRTLDLAEDLPHEGGIDVAAGGDRTVIRERRGPRVGREEVFLDQDPMRSTGKLVERINEWGLTRVKVDSTGLGWGLAGRLRELSSRHNSRRSETTHAAEVVAVNFGAGPPHGYQKKFLNMRAFLWWQVGRELSRLGGWDLGEADDDVIHELTTPRYVILDSYGKIKIEPKKDVIRRLGFSPDRAEALLLAAYDARGVAVAHGWDQVAAGRSLLGAADPAGSMLDDRLDPAASML